MICPYCSQEARWVENKVVYGRNYGKSYMMWWCPDCGAYVGCHSNTQQPLGTMANAELRAWRVKAHAAIDPLWQSGQLSRRQVYALLKANFNRDIHIGSSDIQLCQEIIKWSEK